MIDGRTIARWLNKVADELDARFGPHPRIPRSETLKIAKELVEKSSEPNKDELWQALEPQIAAAFKGSDLDR